MEYLRILIVDDDPEFSRFIKLKLSIEAPHFSITKLESAQQCLEFLKENKVDCILSDYQMPNMNGMELLLALREQGNDISFIFLTAQGNEQVAREAFKNGADDYFTKDFGFAHFARIINSVEQAIKRRDSEKAIKEHNFWVVESQRVARLGSYVLDIPTGRWTSSDILSEILGIQKDAERTVELWVSLLHPQDRERMVQYFAGVLSEKKRFQADYRIIRKNDGEERFVSGLGELVIDQNGEPVKMLGTIQDITERRLIDKERERLYKGISVIKEGVAFTDNDDRFFYVNKAHAGIYGYLPEELIGKTWRDVAPPELVKQSEKAITSTLQNRQIGQFAGEFPGLRKDGTTVPIEVTATALWDENGNYNGHICTVRDITERKKAEATLRDSETRNKKILEAVPDIIFQITKEGRFIDMKYPTEADLYAPASKIIGGRLTDLVPPEVAERAMDCISKALNSDEMQFFEYQLPMPNGVEYYEARIVASGEDEVLSIIRNITERKRAEEERSAFFHMLTHDIKGPLSIIYGYCDIIADSLKGEVGKEIAASIEKAVKRISWLINDMLVVSSLESKDFKLHVQPVSLPQIIIQAVHDSEQLASNKEVTVSVEMEDGFPMLHADGAQLTRAFYNLVSNAVIHNKGGGKVSVKGFCKKGNGVVVVEVADNGQGIPKDDIPRIFDKYHRGRRSGKSGTGLGLAIVKAAIEAHGGTVSVQSVEGEGSTFTVVLPIRRL